MKLYWRYSSSHIFKTLQRADLKRYPVQITNRLRFWVFTKKKKVEFPGQQENYSNCKAVSRTRRRCDEVRLTVSVVRVLDSGHGAAPEHHLVLGERSRLIGEDVLHLAEVLGDVQSSALQVRVRLLVVQVQVLVDEVNLADLHDLDGDEERDGDQHLSTRRKERSRIKKTSAPEKTSTRTGRECTVQTLDV